LNWIALTGIIWCQEVNRKSRKLEKRREYLSLEPNARHDWRSDGLPDWERKQTEVKWIVMPSFRLNFFWIQTEQASSHFYHLKIPKSFDSCLNGIRNWTERTPTEKRAKIAAVFAKTSSGQKSHRSHEINLKSAFYSWLILTTLPEKQQKPRGWLLKVADIRGVNRQRSYFWIDWIWEIQKGTFKWTGGRKCAVSIIQLCQSFCLLFEKADTSHWFRSFNVRKTCNTIISETASAQS
jgi:hypothetical protein